MGDFSRSRAESRFYDAVYGRIRAELTTAVRAEMFEEDIGQNSWLTADEQRRFLAWLDLDGSSEVLDVGSGSGGPALFMVRETGCRITGVELNKSGVEAANATALERGMDDRAGFVCADAREPLPFADRRFDAVVCIDSINHLYERERVFAEWRRVLRPTGRVLFTDPLTVAGMLRHQEVLVRTGSLGDQVLTPIGLDERLLRAAGFDVLRVEDVTANMAEVAAARRRARATHADELKAIETLEQYDAYEQYLRAVELLARERRLTRLVYLARAAGRRSSSR
jgi:cyclopropane fatty-acyl-phospholipid synthase-like methyltransferase